MPKHSVKRTKHAAAQHPNTAQHGAVNERTAKQRSRGSGMGRVLIVVYLILAVAATGRSFYQIVSKFDEAPFAYSLSALAALVYVVATIALIKRRGGWRTVAWIALVFELSGVVIVGILSLTHPELFGHPSVWSHFGGGYLCIPLFLPILGMLWLKNGDEMDRDAAEETAAETDSNRGYSAEGSLY